MLKGESNIPSERPDMYLPGEGGVALDTTYLWHWTHTYIPPGRGVALTVQWWWWQWKCWISSSGEGVWWGGGGSQEGTVLNPYPTLTCRRSQITWQSCDNMMSHVAANSIWSHASHVIKFMAIHNVATRPCDHICNTCATHGNHVTKGRLGSCGVWSRKCDWCQTVMWPSVTKKKGRLDSRGQEIHSGLCRWSWPHHATQSEVNSIPSLAHRELGVHALVPAQSRSRLQPGTGAVPVRRWPWHQSESWLPSVWTQFWSEFQPGFGADSSPVLVWERALRWARKQTIRLHESSGGRVTLSRPHLQTPASE